MRKRKLQAFYHKDGSTIYVIEEHVKRIMKMATDGDFTKLSTVPYYPQDKHLGSVKFEYETNLGKGTITLEGQKHA